MMHANSWGFGMGWGRWIIPLAAVFIIVFFLRGRRQKCNPYKTTGSNETIMRFGSLSEKVKIDCS